MSRGYHNALRMRCIGQLGGAVIGARSYIFSISPFQSARNVAWRNYSRNAGVYLFYNGADIAFTPRILQIRPC